MWCVSRESTDSDIYVTATINLCSYFRQACMDVEGSLVTTYISQPMHACPSMKEDYTSVTKMLKDVGIEVLKVEKQGQSAACMQRDDSMQQS